MAPANSESASVLAPSFQLSVLVHWHWHGLGIGLLLGDGEALISVNFIAERARRTGFATSTARSLDQIDALNLRSNQGTSWIWVSI